MKKKPVLFNCLTLLDAASENKSGKSDQSSCIRLVFISSTNDFNVYQKQQNWLCHYNTFRRKCILGLTVEAHPCFFLLTDHNNFMTVIPVKSSFSGLTATKKAIVCSRFPPKILSKHVLSILF